MSLFDTSVPPELRMKLTGNLSEGMGFLRMPMVEELVSTLPKDPQVNMLVYHGEVKSGGAIPWHIHNGLMLTIVLQGELIFQFPDEAFHYVAGDVLIEPQGVVHRGYNPNPDVPLAAMMVQFTPVGREHVVNIGTEIEADLPVTGRRGVVQPLPRHLGRIDNV